MPRNSQPVEWPEVTFGGPNEPHIDSVGVDERFLAGPKEVVAHGTVAGIPWTLTAFITKPVGEWWEHERPVGPETQFFLGAQGEYGGGGSHAGIPEGSHLTLRGHFFGKSPEIIAWVGFVSEQTDHVEVHLSDGRVRRLDPAPVLQRFPRYFLLFPPRGPEAEVLALDRGGNVLQRERLRQLDVRPNGNAGITVNPISWPAGSPPPGWPVETREFPPGQGPRWQEDFYLHVASFPLYVVPPEAWPGVVALSGAGYHSPGVPHRVAFSYLEDPGTVPERGFEVANLHPAEATRFRSTGDPSTVDPLEGHRLVETLGRFVSPEVHDRLHVPPGVPPLARTGTERLEVLGARRLVDRWSVLQRARTHRVAAVPAGDRNHRGFKPSRAGVAFYRHKARAHGTGVRPLPSYEERPSRQRRSLGGKAPRGRRELIVIDGAGETTTLPK